jgi:uncharacterized Zn-finger protein
MFDQIKSEPLHFYQTPCPPAQIMAAQQQMPVHQQNQVQHTTVIAMNDDKQENILPTLVDQIKPEIMMPQQNIHQTHVGTTATQTTTSTSVSRGSKPQACKVCGKVLSSASSYYVHMKLHSGTKPFQCNYLIDC